MPSQKPQYFYTGAVQHTKNNPESEPMLSGLGICQILDQRSQPTDKYIYSNFLNNCIKREKYVFIGYISNNFYKFNGSIKAPGLNVFNLSETNLIDGHGKITYSNSKASIRYSGGIR